MDVHVPRTVPITYEMVAKAYQKVEIPKKDGEFRKLGIPTIRDSYGYRPLKSSHEALEQVVKNCIECDWVVDLDISNFFGELDHSLLQKAVEAMIQEKWVMMYVDRWLKAKIERADGTQYSTEGKGTPQGGVISPLLANLYLHFSLDEWLRQNYPTVRFVSYADDIVVHCKSEAEAKAVMQAIQQRLSEVKLRLNETKSKIVYCKDYRRKGKHEQVQFGFLGFSFQPRAVQSKVQPGTSYMGFTAEISVENQKKIRDTVRTSVNWRDTTMELTDIAVRLNSKLRGWINYFSLRGRRHLRNTMIYVDVRLLKWLQRKHKQGLRATLRQLAANQKLHPRLFYHWEKGYCYNVKEMTRAV